MKSGEALLQWAYLEANSAVERGLAARALYSSVAAAIAEAYVRGGIDALKEETERWAHGSRKREG